MKNRLFVGLGLLLALALFLLAVGKSAGAQRNGAASRASVSAAGAQKDEASQSITVLTVDADSGAPLTGWTMRLYPGPGCSGSAIQTGVTNADGLVSFTDLGAGAYSIQETLRPGYLNVSPLCQDVTLAQSPSGDGRGSSSNGCNRSYLPVFDVIGELRHTGPPRRIQEVLWRKYHSPRSLPQPLMTLPPRSRWRRYRSALSRRWTHWRRGS